MYRIFSIACALSAFAILIAVTLLLSNTNVSPAGTLAVFGVACLGLSFAMPDWKGASQPKTQSASLDEGTAWNDPAAIRA